MAKDEKKSGGPAEKAAKEREPKDNQNGKLDRAYYEQELLKLQIELVKLQEWVERQGPARRRRLRGPRRRGQGRRIKRITEALNPRVCRVVALPVPTDRERTQWYFQRYVEQLPAAGEIVLFDRSLVQPRRRRARHGLRAPSTRSRSSSASAPSSSACCCAPASRW